MINKCSADVSNPTDHRDEDLTKDMNHHSGKMSTQFPVNDILSGRRSLVIPLHDFTAP